MIRFIWVICNVVFWTPIWATVGIIFSVFNWSGRSIAWAGRQWSKILLFIGGITYTVNGLENLNPDRQYVFTANHESAFDILLVFAALPYQLVFLSKKELKHIPFMGWAMMIGRHFFVDRSNNQAALKSIAAARESLQLYPRSIMIFPEGMRSADGEMKPFKKGGTILGIKTGLPIVPMAICGTYDVYRKGSFHLKSQTIGLVIGRPIPTTGISFAERNKVTETLQRQVVNLKSSWQQE